MKLEYISNASFFITFNDGRTLLTDPWYTSGIYHGAMHNFPPISPERWKKYTTLKPDFIYISHMHGDHFDPPTLMNYPKDTTILIGAFPTPGFRLALKSFGFVDVRELPFGEITEIEGLDVCIFPQFSGSSDDFSDESGSLIDTSIFLRENDGKNLFFCVDNPMQNRHAKMIANDFGPIDCAILPYSGASIYPFVFRNYDHDEKNRRVEVLRQSRLDNFRKHAATINACKTIPAAGSFVLGGPAAHNAQYMHQSTPDQIEQDWIASGMPGEGLCQLTIGDELDLNTNSVTLAEDAVSRSYSTQDRTDYAQSIADFPCNLDEITLPSGLNVPWKSLISKARASVWRQQEAKTAFPAADVHLIITGTDTVPLPIDNTMTFKIALEEQGLSSADDNTCPQVRFFMTSNLLLSILLGTSFWNIAEWHMEIDRTPDIFNPTIHRLMAHFKL